jgi:hypothetical protein
MTNIYLNQFNTSTATFPVALQSVLSQYVTDSFSGKNEQISADEKALLTDGLKKQINNLIEHLKTATIGKWVQKYQFTAKLPADLSQLLSIAKLKEQAAFLAPSALVCDCENIAAAEAFSAHVIFRQVARLEKALKDNEVEERHQITVKSKIVEWIALLYEKFALMMIESVSLENLNATVDNVFDKALCQDLPKLSDFYDHVSGQIDYLDNNDFFDDFYESIKLSDKYEFVYEFYQAMKARAEKTKQPIIPELRATMIHLFYQTINKAYAPCEVEKFNLMRDQGATIEAVFSALQEWTKENWVIYKDTDFEIELAEKLSKERKTYEDWQQVCDMASPVKGKRPMFHAHCVKYASDPNQDPKDVIQALKLIPSPVKPKPPTKISATTANVTPAARDLLSTSILNCDEVLEDDLDVASEHSVKRTRV